MAVKKPARGRPPVGKVRIQLKLAPEVKNALAQAAKAAHTTQSELAQTAISEYLKTKRR